MNQELTVAVCAYNAGKYLTESLDSLEKQSIDFQIMLIDDCSRDETLRIMTRVSKNTGRKVILKHMNENRGTAYCRNWALHHADTKLMMFFDADDIAFPDLVGALYQKIMSSHRYIAVSCYSLYIDQYGKRIGGGSVLDQPQPRIFCTVQKRVS